MSTGKQESDYVEKTDSIVDNLKSWLFSECKSNGITISDVSAKIIEDCVRNAIQNRVINAWEIFISLHPEANIHPPCSFLENPVLHLVGQYGYDITKCPTTADFPMRGVTSRLYQATTSGIYYVWKPDLRCYTRFYRADS